MKWKLKKEIITWIIHNTKFAEVNSEVGLDIYPEDIHIMRKVSQ